ncbi:DUF1353 domain-containing protein [Helicobacter canis]|uniref:Protein of uncharacterized function (DUF1353) n=1 Tax=Helicobacter canis TaxID=29419 RepID=A0A377J1X1_9HELI|nr:DUF1353 domain-containing protein [Helicobacter canis]STO96234.1 Protein of uncharacterised function (DUF1353) [Helicobacter canis]STP06463.1 Protein of uncharacterised function (DUF1353) [Helicobacter canis]
MESQELARFTEPIEVRFSNDGKSLTLLQGFYYYRKGSSADDQSAIKVPRGFHTDGFSNFGADFVLPRFGKGLKCAVLHDYLCVEFHAGRVSRVFADKVFLEAMIETRAFSRIKAYMIYASVRIYAICKGYK